MGFCPMLLVRFKELYSEDWNGMEWKGLDRRGRERIGGDWNGMERKGKEWFLKGE